jgi:SpoVK/Ycf46/Vps4 family AAA+-type ATPase
MKTNSKDKSHSETDYILTAGKKSIRLELFRGGDSARVSINSMLREHFGCDPNLFPIVEIGVPPYDVPNLSRAVDKYLEADARSAKLIGVRSEYGNTDMSDLLRDENDASAAMYCEGSLQYAHVELPGKQKIACVSQGLYMICAGNLRLAALISESRNGFKLEVTSSTREVADEFISSILAVMPDVNIYKGKIVSAVQNDSGAMELKFQELPSLTREALILPEGVLDLIERHTITFSRRSARLLKARRHLKRGLLLHGEPGTGKTLTAMYLAQAMEGRTTVLLSGSSMSVLSGACRFARELQPATLILEDIDLIAEDRSRSTSNSLLFELLNEMDGLAEDADILFVLTTNRPEVLEAALSQRPGRVDLAVKIPLPDDNCRRRLFELYGEGLNLNVAELDHYVKRTSGASAAFIRELMRRASLLADEDGELLRVNDEHLKQALDELSTKDSGLTRSVLGFSGSRL